MSNVTVIESAVVPYINLVLTYENEEAKVVTETFRLCYDYAAILRAEETTGVDIKNIENWTKVTSSMVPKLVHAGLARYHKDVTLDRITSILNPGIQRELTNAVFEMLFPGVFEALKKADESAKTGDSKNAQGGDSNAAVASV